MPSREVAPDGSVKFVTRIMHFPGLQSTFSVFLEDAIGKSADFSFRERGAWSLLRERSEIAAEK
jgi:hypothetical protein